MRLAWGGALVSVACVATLCAVAYLQPPEPVYGGKRLTEWLDAGAEPAEMAVHEIGPAATPWILKKLRWEHPRWGRWQTYQSCWRRVPVFARPALPKPRVAAFDEYRAATVLLEVGPQVIPQLTAALKENNPAVRITCAMALGSLRERGLTDSRSLDALRAAMQDDHPEVRKGIAAVIAKAEPQPRQ